MKKALFLIITLYFTAFAHFQVIYTPHVETVQKEVTFQLFFTHPFEGDPVLRTGLMQNGTVKGLKSVYMIHKGNKTDCTPHLKKITFAAKKDKGPAFKLVINSKTGYKSGGDYAIVVVPHPYWEPGENLYIQQITKLLVNKGGFETDWQNRCVKDYPEIIPLVKPYDVVAGGLFRGVVLDNSGKAVVGAAVEVEYLNYTVDMNQNMLLGEAKIKNEKIGVTTVISDANGVFAYIPKRNGYWGFAALSAGTQKTFNGKELEQDPVIWIKVSSDK